MLANLIIPTLTRYDLLERLFESITYPVKHILVIDNGGKWHATYDHHSAEHTTVLRMPSNLGVAGSWNLGVKAFPHAPYWAYVSDDAYFQPGTLERMAQTGPDDMLMSTQAPHWHAFTIGENVIRSVGLWCEGYHPAYFEDTDFTLRSQRAGVVQRNVLEVGHNNSSTLHGSQHFQNRNAETFRRNHDLWQQRKSQPRLDAGQWDLDRRRSLEWVE